MTYFYGVSCHNLEMFKGNQCLHSETTQYTFTEHSHSLLWSILHKIMTYFFIEEGTVVPRERKKKGYSHVSQAIFKRMRKKKTLIIKNEIHNLWVFQDFLSHWKKWEDQISWKLWNSHTNELVDYNTSSNIIWVVLQNYVCSKIS